MAVCLLFLLVQVGQPLPSTGHPLAPSIPQLTPAQEKRIDGIIERFILFDTGKLKGAAGKQAYYDFQALGPEAIFQLIDAFNRTAEMEHSCPVVLIGKKIAGILSASKDLQLLTFAKENLGAGIQARRHLGVVRDLRFHAQVRRSAVQRQLALASRFSPPPPSNPRPRLPAGSAPKPMERSLEDLLRSLERGGPDRPALLVELSRLDSPEVVSVLVRFIEGPDAALADQAENLLSDRLGREDRQALASWARDPRPALRSAVAAAVGKQARPDGAILLRLLADEDRAVQQAARRALVRHAAGQDFGPSPGASPESRDEAVRHWRSWWSQRPAR